MNKPDFQQVTMKCQSRDEVLDGIKTSNKLPTVHSSAKVQSEKGPKIVNCTDSLHGFERPDGLYEAFVIDPEQDR